MLNTIAQTIMMNYLLPVFWDSAPVLHMDSYSDTGNFLLLPILYYYFLIFQPVEKGFESIE